MELSRRSFLKRGLAFGSGAAAAGSVAAAAQTHAKAPYKLKNVKEVTNICCYCSGGCGTICSSRDGELINLEGDPDHPVNLGGLCPKGAAMWGLRNIVTPDRKPSFIPIACSTRWCAVRGKKTGNVSPGNRPWTKSRAT